LWALPPHPTPPNPKTPIPNPQSPIICNKILEKKIKYLNK